jgi:hypothetical protein
MTEQELNLFAKQICQAVEQRTDDCNMEMHARVKDVILAHRVPQIPEPTHKAAGIGVPPKGESGASSQSTQAEERVL